MTSSILDFPSWHLGYLLILLLPVWWIVFRWAGQGATLPVALARMVLQLIGLGYVLVFLFTWDSPAALLSALVVMTFASSWIALRPIGTRPPRLWLLAMASIAIGALIPLAVATQLVIQVKPWYMPRYMIPLAGMCFSQAMNGVSLAAERLVRELSLHNSWEYARRQALQTALIPVTNQLMAVGLVSIPGMFTGQVLAGASPLLAARYQIIIMSMMLAAIVFSVVIFTSISRSHVSIFTESV